MRHETITSSKCTFNLKCMPIKHSTQFLLFSFSFLVQWYKLKWKSWLEKKKLLFAFRLNSPMETACVYFTATKTNSTLKIFIHLYYHRSANTNVQGIVTQNIFIPNQHLFDYSYTSPLSEQTSMLLTLKAFLHISASVGKLFNTSQVQKRINVCFYQIGRAVYWL